MGKTSKHCILITGASTGIGAAASTYLASQGHQVFAGVRSIEAQQNLKNLNSNLNPIMIDVTNRESIIKAEVLIANARDQSLPFCLINNAGIGNIAPMDKVEMSELRHTFDVNFFGAIETIQIFLPMLKANQGRIVNVSALAVYSCDPFIGPYSTSKIALEAASDTLRRELAPFGVKVIILQLGSMKTPIWSKTRLLHDLNQQPATDAEIKRFRQAACEFDKWRARAFELSPEVSHIYPQLDELMQPNLKRARIVSATAEQWFNSIWCRMLPSAWVDRSLINRFYLE